MGRDTATSRCSGGREGGHPPAFRLSAQDGLRLSTVPYLKFPADDVRDAQQDRSYRQGALVCKRGHVARASVSVREPVDNKDEKCSGCGAPVLLGCPGCGQRIRGWYYGVMDMTYTPPKFCDGCGMAMPWATRKERIYELENILDQAEINEGERLFISERLRELHDMDGSDLKKQAKIWQAMGKISSIFVTNPAVMRIGEGLGVEGAGSVLFG